MSAGKDQMNRRSFMVNTAKVVIPTLGIMGLTLAEFRKQLLRPIVRVPAQAVAQANANEPVVIFAPIAVPSVVQAIKNSSPMLRGRSLPC